MDEDTPRQRAAGALAEGLILLGLGVALQFAQRWASDPDALRRAKMTAARQVERAAARAAGELWMLAERARLLYENERD